MLIRPIPWIEPAEAMLAWSDDPVFALLESAGPITASSRYSYLAVEPYRVLTQANGIVSVDGKTLASGLLGRLAVELRVEAADHAPTPVPFRGGAVGFIGYDLARETGGVAGHRSADQPEALFGFYDIVIGFDRLDRRAWIVASGMPAAPADRPRRAADRLDHVLERLRSRPASCPPAIPAFAWQPALARVEYEARVARIIEHIREGDIYQANFTCRQVAARPDGLTAADFYARLRERSPAPFAALLSCGSMQIASASPERFIRLDAAGRLQTRPIKGTRPRGATPEEDLAEQTALSASAKDQAENLMIVDLMRHDLGRVAMTGSVVVPSLNALESFAQVHHLVSTVEAELKPDLGAVDVLRQTLPGGSITGAPKIRAMQIIDAIEGCPRGAYCGIIGWLGFDGAMDTSIAIRTVTLLPDRLEAQAGGGIVADSVPADEYDEMRVKLAPLLLEPTP